MCPYIGGGHSLEARRTHSFQSSGGFPVQPGGVVDILGGGTVIGVRAGKLNVIATAGLATGQTPVEVVAR